MKTRQFKQLASLTPADRLSLLIEGLEAVADTIDRIEAELKICENAGAHRAGRLLRLVGREEAGKFLILIDAWRSPHSTQPTIARHFGRAGDHLSKLIYAQIADYSIASQDELLRAVEMHRQPLYLDGPNDVDWIFPNRLIAEREGALYVDLVDSEGMLEWSPISDDPHIHVPTKSMRLVQALRDVQLISPEGCAALTAAWYDFDPLTDSHYQDWASRTNSALDALWTAIEPRGGWEEAARLVVQLWPMPLVEIDIAQVKVTPTDLEEERAKAAERFFRQEYGYPDPESNW